MHHFQIVSAPMPVGVSWLINCLLELGVRTTSQGTWWSEGASGGLIEPANAREDLSWTLPVLQDRRRFNFRDEIEVFWGHQLAFAQYPARKTILCVRDPRDAAYSQFRRQVHRGNYSDNAADLQTFLEQPQIWWGSFEPLFDLPPADTLAYFDLFWRHQIEPGDLLVLRFEDVKADPAAQLVRVLNFLGLQRSRSDLQRALDSSEFARGLALNADLQARTGQPHLSARAGLVGEGKSRFTQPALACFGGPAARALGAFGYEVQTNVVGPDQELVAQAGPLLAECHRLFEQGASDQAEVLLRQSLENADQIALKDLLAGQWLALLWTRSVMQNAQLGLPSAARMMRFFSTINAQYADWPPLRRAAKALLEPDHALQQVWPRQAIFTRPGASFADAAAAAQTCGLPFFLWQQPGTELSPTGIEQLRALLVWPHPPAVAAAIPSFDDGPEADFTHRAQAAHAQAGAEFSRVRLRQLPPCILLRTTVLAGLTGLFSGGFQKTPENRLKSWLGSLWVHQALGVLASGRFDQQDHAQV